MKAQSLQLKALGSLIFAVGTVALYYGFVMTFMVPGVPGEFLSARRMLYGLAPLVAAIFLLCLAGNVFCRSSPNPKRRLSDVVWYCIGGAMLAVFLFCILAGLFRGAKR